MPGRDRVRDVGEEALIERLRRRCRSPAPPQGIGDDAARLRPRAGRDLAWTTDLLVEGVHFRREWTPARLLGRKALAVNLSDLGAMGAEPRAFLLGLSLPASLPASWVDALAQGIAETARAAGALCVGGDTTASRGGVGISISAAGELPRGRLLARSGARPGDSVWVSGPLGGAAAGLRLLRRGQGLAARGGTARLLRAHLDPRPPLSLGPWLLRRRLARAAIDLSDGLSTDLARLCRASGVGARIDAERVPVHPALRAEPSLDARHLALHGGEDYALLFAVPRRREAELRYLPPEPRLRPVRIGEIVPQGQGIRVRDAAGRERAFRALGFRHFPGEPVP